MSLLLVVLAICLGLGDCHRKQVSPESSPQIIARSHLSPGNHARLNRVMQKAQRGEPITIGFIGGSITHGQGASKPELAYASLVAKWWIDTFPQSKITVVNAGVNGTNSAYGCLRVQRDLLYARPDFVIVEFGVNDRDDLAHVQTYEGVVRQIVADPDQPAVMLVFPMHHDGTNAQTMQSEVGKQYQLPMISYRDALWPEIMAGRLKWADITSDAEGTETKGIHPNDRGHAAIAEFVDSFLQDSLDHLPASPGAIPPLPPPKYTDLFARMHRVDAADLKPIVCDGWTLDALDHCWKSSMPNSVIEFDVTGSAVDLLYARVSPNGGTVRVSVDDGTSMLCDAWFDGTWEGYVQTDLVGHNLSSGTHRARIELVSQKNALSHGNEFRIIGLAGTGN